MIANVSIYLSASRTETTSARCFIKVIDNFYFWSRNLFKNKLCNSITLLDAVISFRSIIQDNKNFIAIIFVNHPGKNVDTIFVGQTAARSNSAISSRWNSHCQTCSNRHTTKSRDHNIYHA
ncbi:hypothetical protein FR483_n268R [Paramecium bursaria Chlorella virus FR483]|uniref:Uncharacterized protein n268R n=1 Tax=Paramecium bursaria Chlorella virus FR483 TaxID=399781 RepID=A7J6X2_PBCVF|nr:hypothetical protein FR483_n268R [Paramecium bursaria Chlorella virus FR483]ABT15553.1 hypothetical protein FR483_n268R [Paramecium bursaria Chlorella virus FR483]